MPPRKRGRPPVLETESSTDESDFEIDIEEFSDTTETESNTSPKRRKLSPATKKTRRKNSSPRGRPSKRRSARLQSTTSSTEPNDLVPECTICYGTEADSDDSDAEELLTCSECKVANHPSCLKLAAKISKKVRNYLWQCEDCKTCFICDTAGSENKLLLCDGCDKGFHMFCLTPKMKHSPKGQWLCQDCQLSDSEQPSVESSTSTCTGAVRDSSQPESTKPNTPIAEKVQVKDADSSVSSGSVKKRGRGRPRKEKNISVTPTFSTPSQTDADSEQSVDTSVEVTPASTPNVTSPKRGTRRRRPSFKKIRIDVKQKKCRTPGCDGSGHVTGRFSMHHVQSGCPKFHNLTPEQCQMRANKRAQNKEKSATKLESPVSLQESPRKSLRSKVQLNFMPEKVRAAVMNKEIIPDGPSLSRQKPKNSVAVPRTRVEKNGAQASVIGESSLSHVEQLNEEALRGIASEYDFNLFKEAWTKAMQANDEEMYEPLKGTTRCIVLGPYEIGTWYTSPYPEEFLRLKTIYICEFCLKYAKSSTILRRHMVKCSWRHPPGDEIYRKNGISVWEVDGKKSKGYCQNLCLMAKLFLDHKTLYYDVEPFLFYVMTKADNSGCHFLGYFSKEKKSFLNYNVSCILTLPQYMRQGFGKMLIDFSYLLSKAEGKTGSPEKPLSDLGLISYRSYWKGVIMKYLMSYGLDRLSIKDISQETALHPSDIVSTLQYLGILKYWKGKHVILRSQELYDDYVKKISLRPPDYQEIDPNNLQWTPPALEPQTRT